jgi:hypothetical protein
MYAMTSIVIIKNPEFHWLRKINILSGNKSSINNYDNICSYFKVEVNLDIGGKSKLFRIQQHTNSTQPSTTWENN